jgi:hypothetical protein
MYVCASNNKRVLHNETCDGQDNEKKNQKIHQNHVVIQRNSIYFDDDGRNFDFFIVMPKQSKKNEEIFDEISINFFVFGRPPRMMEDIFRFCCTSGVRSSSFLPHAIIHIYPIFSFYFCPSIFWVISEWKIYGEIMHSQ